MISNTLFIISVIFILYTVIGYPSLLFVLNKTIRKKNVNTSKKFKPMVSVIIAAHNEEKVIEKKLLNLVSLNYPKELIEIIVSSDNSTDKTNQIIETFIEKHSYENIKIYYVNERKGKTNAQDEAVAVSNGEILVFSDANSMLAQNSVEQIVSFFYDTTISYVSGKLCYVNSESFSTSESESNYWNYDLFMRQVESNISSITAGNGALYGVRRTDYEIIDPVFSHDSIFPQKMVIKGKKAKFNPDALAFEKAGENDKDEFKRKVRMSRKVLTISFTDLKKYNVFKYTWFSLFYFSHRLLRNNLYLFHIICYFSNILVLQQNYFFCFTFVLQNIFYLLSIFGINIKKSIFSIPFYYCMTIFAQLIGAKNQLLGKSKPFWEKAESTR